MNRTLWTALVTPLLESGGVDYESLGSILSRQDAAGNGLVLLGSTGEGFHLDRADKESIIRFVSSLKLSVPVLAGVYGSRLESAAAWIDFCNDHAIDGYLIVGPLYAKPGFYGQITWFRRLFDLAKKPCMVYNIPSRTGCHLQPDALKTLKDHPNFWAIKECSGALSTFLTWRQALPDIQLLSGDDGLFWQQTAAGADGLVSVMSNPWPVWTRAYVRACFERPGRLPDAVWSEAAQALFAASNPVPVKILMHLLGLIAEPKVRLPLHLSDLADYGPLLAANQAVRIWSEGRRTCA